MQKKLLLLGFLGILSLSYGCNRTINTNKTDPDPGELVANIHACQDLLTYQLIRDPSTLELTNHYEQVIAENETWMEGDDLIGYYFSFEDQDPEYFTLSLREKYPSREVAVQHYLVDKGKGSICIQDYLSGECGEELNIEDPEYASSFAALCSYEQTKNQNQTEEISPENTITSLMQTFGLLENEVIQGSFDWYLGASDERIQLSGPQVELWGIANPGALHDRFWSQGWVDVPENSYADISEGSAGYSKNGVICYLYQYLDENSLDPTALAQYHEQGWIDSESVLYNMTISCAWDSFE